MANWKERSILVDTSTPAQYGDWANRATKVDTSPKIGQAESAIRGLQQGSTLGFGDEIIGGAIRGYDYLSGLMGNSVTDVNKQLAEQGFKGDIGPTSGADLYQQTVNNERAQNYAARQAHPITYSGTQIAGSLAPSLLIPGLSAAKGASITRGAVSGGALGALMGAGETQNDLTSKQGLIDVAKSGLFGAITGGIGQKIANKIGATTADDIAREAEIRSAQAQGLERGTRKSLSKGDILEERKVRAIGRQGLDEGVVSIGADAKSMIAKNNEIKKAAMDSRLADYSKIDVMGASKFSPFEAASKVEEKIIGGLNRSYDDTKALIQKIDPDLNNILSRGEGNISMQEAQKLVSSLSKKAKFDKTRSNETNDLAEEIYHTVRDYINDSAEKAGNAIGVEGLKESIVKANKQFSIAKNADKILANKLARESNKKFTLTDVIALSGQNPLYYFPKKIYEEYGDKGSALLLNKVAKAMVENPKLFGKFQGALERSAMSGPIVFNAMYNKLSKNNPEFRNKVKNIK